MPLSRRLLAGLGADEVALLANAGATDAVPYVGEH